MVYYGIGGGFPLEVYQGRAEMPAGISLGRALWFRISGGGLEERMGAGIDFLLLLSLFFFRIATAFLIPETHPKPRHETNFLSKVESNDGMDSFAGYSLFFNECKSGMRDGKAWFL